MLSQTTKNKEHAPEVDKLALSRERYNARRYLVIAAIIGTEFCERLSYYGINGSLILFLQTRLSESKATATFNVSLFVGVCYLTPLLGGYVADTFLGRFYTILLFSMFYLLGITGICIVSWILTTSAATQTEQVIFWVSLYLIALGAGGIKPNVSTLGAEQFETDQSPHSLSKKEASDDAGDNELMPMPYTMTEDSDFAAVSPAPSPHSTDTIASNIAWGDNRMQKDANPLSSALILNEPSPPPHTVQQALQTQTTAESENQNTKAKESFFRWFYFSINLGSLVSFTVIAYICQNVSFSIGYTIPMVALLVGILIFVAASKHYHIVPAQGSVLTIFVPIACYALCNGGFDAAKQKYDASDVHAVQCVCRLFPFLALNIVYWCVGTQIQTMFYAQGCQMNIVVARDVEIPIAALGLFDIVPILILLPLFDKCLIPALRRRGFRVTMLQRMGAGFVFAMLAMLCAAIVEWQRKQLPLSTYASACNQSGDNDDDDETASQIVYVTDISIFWQIPQFLFVGISEVLTSVTGLEFFFSESPENMRSIVSSLNLVTTGLGSWSVGLLIKLSNCNKRDLWITEDLNDGHLDWYFMVVAVLCLMSFFVFVWVANSYQYQHRGKREKKTTSEQPRDQVPSSSDDDCMFDKVLQTAPADLDLDVSDVTTPRSIKNMDKLL